MWNGSPSGVLSSEDFAGKQTRWPERWPRSCPRSERDLWPPRWVRERLYESNSTARSAASRGGWGSAAPGLVREKTKEMKLKNHLRSFPPSDASLRCQRVTATAKSLTVSPIMRSLRHGVGSLFLTRVCELKDDAVSQASSPLHYPKLWGTKIDGFEMKERKKCKI